MVLLAAKHLLVSIAQYYTSEPIERPSRPIHLNVHIEFDPGMAGRRVFWYTA